MIMAYRAISLGQNILCMTKKSKVGHKERFPEGLDANNRHFVPKNLPPQE
jgi:hypothetical protein